MDTILAAHNSHYDGTMGLKHIAVFAGYTTTLGRPRSNFKLNYLRFDAEEGVPTTEPLAIKWPSLARKWLCSAVCKTS